MSATSAANTLIVNAPFDGQVLGELECHDAAAVERMLDTADRLHRTQPGGLPVHRRVAILEGAAALLAGRAEEFAVKAAREGGKPLVDSRIEITRAVDGLKLCAMALRTQAGREIPMGATAASAGRLAFTTLRPIGPVVAISAFNHPVNLIVHQVGPAIAAGCPVIVKPAAATPLSCINLVSLFYEAGLPEEWCQVALPANRRLSEALAVDGRVAFLSFIGSASVGWQLRSRVAPGTRCALEHGGVAPVLVREDADLEAIVAPLTKGAFYHAGQVCISVQRVFVNRSVAERFAELLAEQARKLKVGDPTDAETDVGPIISRKEVNRVALWVDEGVKAGATLVDGGRALSDSLYAPTVLLNPPDRTKVVSDEIFGPVCCILPYDTEAEAIMRANTSPYAFQASVFTREIEGAMRAFARLNASTVMINDHTAFRTDWMPFAGLRQSGLGVGGIEYTMRDMRVEKMMVVKVSDEMPTA